MRQFFNQLGFAGGEMAREMWARTDIQKRAVCVETMRNFFPTIAGACLNRPGFEWVAGAASDSSNIRLIPFEYNTIDAYALELSDLRIRVIRNGGYVLKSYIPSNITQAAPAVVEVSDSDAGNGDEVDFSAVAGMTEINGSRYTLANRTDVTATITGVSNANPCVVTAANSFTDGQVVYLADIAGMTTALNTQTFRVNNRTGADFELQYWDGAAWQDLDTSSTATYGTYSSGGTARRRTYELNDRDGNIINSAAWTAFSYSALAGFDWLYTIVSPFVSADLFKLRFTQTADIMTLSFHDYCPRELTRSAHTSFTLSKLNFTPVMESPGGVTISPTSYNDAHFYRENGLNRTCTVSNITNGATTRIYFQVRDGSGAGQDEISLYNNTIISITDADGMTEVNGLNFLLTDRTRTGAGDYNFELKYVGGGSINSTGWGTYTAGTAQYGIQLLKYKVTAVSESTGEESLATAEPDPRASDYLSDRGFCTVACTAPSGGDVKHYNVYKEANGIYGFIGSTPELYFNDRNITPELGINPTDSARNPFQATITGITQASPGVITSEKHNYSVGDRVLLEDITGMTELNDTFAWVRDDANFTKDAFAIEDENGDPIDTSGYTAYSSGGTASDYPMAVTYFNQRRVFANKYNERQSMDLSETGLPSTFHDAGDAFSFDVSSAQVNEIRHLLSSATMLLFTSGSIIDSNSGGNALNLQNIRNEEQTSDGVGDVAPIKMRDSVLYIEALYSKVYDISYNFESNGYRGRNRTVLVPHYFEDGVTIVDWAYQKTPHPIVWCVMSDGALKALTYDRDNDVWAWSSHDTDGFFESVCVVPEAKGHTLYAVIRRTINGNTRKYIEKLHTRQMTTLHDAFFVDSGLSLDNAISVSGVTETAVAVQLTATAHGLSDDTLIRVEDVSFDDGTTLYPTQYRVGGAATNDFYLLGPDPTPVANIVSLSLSGTDVIVTHDGSGGKGLQVNEGDAVFLTGTGTVGDNKWYYANWLSETTYRLMDFTQSLVDGSLWGLPVTVGTHKKTSIIDPADWPGYLSGGEIRECVSTVSGLDHLEGKTVAVLNDGAVETQKVVSAGAITLDTPGAKVHVGLPIQGEVKLLPLDNATGDYAGHKIDLHEAVVKVHQTKGLTFGPRTTKMQAVPSRKREDLGNTAPWRSEDITIPLTAHPDRDGQLVIRQDNPLPATLLSAGYYFESSAA